MKRYPVELEAGEREALVAITRKGSHRSQRVVNALVLLSCGDPPEGRAQWSLRLLANRAVELGYIDGVSRETVHRVLRKARSNRVGASAG